MIKIAKRLYSQTQLHGWGSSTMFQLGKKTSDSIKFEDKFKVPNLENLEIRNVATGWNFSLVSGVDRNNQSKLYSFGLNSHGQLGHSQRDILGCFEAKEIKFDEIRTIHAIACGRTHSLVSIKDNNGIAKTFSFGNNCFGQCGQTLNHKKIETPVEIASLRGIDINQLSCSLDTSFAVTSENELYSWGWGADGQLGGSSHLPKEPIPSKMDLNGVIKISAMGDCGLALTKNGVYGWGNNEYKQTMTDSDSEAVRVPCLVQGIDHTKVLDIKHCGTFGIILLDSGDLVIKGTVLDKNNNDLNVKKIEGKNIKSIYNGLEYAYMKTATGDVYYFGTNLWACLNEKKIITEMPEKFIEAPEMVNLSLGPTHTLALKTI